MNFYNLIMTFSLKIMSRQVHLATIVFPMAHTQGGKGLIEKA